MLNLKDIKIYDRINFAVRLLKRKKLILFNKYLGSKLVKLPYLDNLLFFTKRYKSEISKTLG